MSCTEVTIIGAGIGGLVTALTLHKVGIPCTVYESVGELKPLGVGINLQPYCVRELFALGMEKELSEEGISARGLAYYTNRGQHVLTEKLGTEAGFNWPQFHIHRGAFQMLLAREVRRRMGPDVIRMGHRCIGIEQSAGYVTAHFVDRSGRKTTQPATADVLVAADGMHSTIRAHFYPDEKPPHWNRCIMWRGVTENVCLLDGHTMSVTGSYRQKFVSYQIRKPGEERIRGEDGIMLNWLCELLAPDDMEFRPEDWNRKGNVQEFAPEFRDWVFPWVNVPDIVARNSGIWEFPQVDRDPLPKWSFERVALLGDAAHPITPIGSNGASLSVVDACVLARELAIGKADVQAALKAYDEERRPAMNRVLEGNRGGGPEKFLPLVEERAPCGFEDIKDVLSDEELSIATNYRASTGLTTDLVNNSQSLIPPELSVN